LQETALVEAELMMPAKKLTTKSAATAANTSARER